MPPRLDNGVYHTRPVRNEKICGSEEDLNLCYNTSELWQGYEEDDDT